MPRKILENQLVTYKKRIVYQTPNNNNKNWFAIFLDVLKFQFLATTIGLLTGGLGAAILQGANFSQLAISTSRIAISSLSNFLLFQFNDLLNKNVTTKNTLINLLFSLNEWGKIGRGVRQQKIITLANQEKIFQKMGLNFEVKNFWQAQQKLALTDVITKNKVVLRFGKEVTETQILQSIASVVSGELKKELKKMSFEELKSLLEIEKLLRKLNKNLLPKYNNLDTQKYDQYLKKISNISLEDFTKLNDLDAITILSDLAKTKVGNQTILKINEYRLLSKFQESLIGNFIKIKRKIINSSKKINPFYWLNKLVNKIFEPVQKQFQNISKKISFSINNFINKKAILNNFLVPCRPDSFLLGFKFEPIGLSGEGILEIHKKDYISKKTGKISKYRPIRVFTTLIEVEAFAASQHQNSYYLNNWALGWGYSQQEFEILNFLSPKLANIVNQNIRFFSLIKSIPTLIKNFNLSKNLERKSSSFQRKWINKLFGSLFSSIPGLSFFTPILSQKILNHEIKDGAIINTSYKGIKYIRSL